MYLCCHNSFQRESESNPTYHRHLEDEQMAHGCVHLIDLVARLRRIVALNALRRFHLWRRDLGALCNLLALHRLYRNVRIERIVERFFGEQRHQLVQLLLRATQPISSPLFKEGSCVVVKQTTKRANPRGMS